MNYNRKRLKRNFFDFLVLLIFLVFLIRRMFVYKKTTRWDLCGLVINYCHEVTDFAERGSFCYLQCSFIRSFAYSAPFSSALFQFSQAVFLSFKLKYVLPKLKYACCFSSCSNLSSFKTVS